MTDYELRALAAASGNEKLIGEVAFDLLAKEMFTAVKTKANSNHTHSADQITDGTTKSIPTKAKQADWDTRVTQSELQNAVKEFASGLRFRGVYETLEAAKEAIETPKEGDFIITTTGKNSMYIYEAETVNDWQSLGDLFVPGKATQSADGLMAKEDKKKLDGIETGANRYVLPVATTAVLGGVKAKSDGVVTISAEGVIDVAAEKVITSAERTKWNKASTDATAALTASGQNTTNLTALTEKVGGIETKVTAAEKTIVEHTGKISTLEGTVGGHTTTIGQHTTKLGELEAKFVYMTNEEALEIVNKYKA